MNAGAFYYHQKSEKKKSFTLATPTVAMAMAAAAMHRQASLSVFHLKFKTRSFASKH